jgi:hypothetical protein
MSTLRTNVVLRSPFIKSEESAPVTKKTRNNAITSHGGCEPCLYEGDHASELSCEAGDQPETSSLGGDNFEYLKREQYRAEDISAPSVTSNRLNDSSMVCDNDEGSRFATSIVQTVRRFYSTTSSVYAEQTISNPNVTQILFW